MHVKFYFKTARSYKKKIFSFIESTRYYSYENFKSHFLLEVLAVMSTFKRKQ